MHPAFLAQANCPLGEAFEHQVVEVTVFEQPNRWLQTIAAEPGATANTYHVKSPQVQSAPVA